MFAILLEIIETGLDLKDKIKNRKNWNFEVTSLGTQEIISKIVIMTSDTYNWPMPYQLVKSIKYYPDLQLFINNID